MISSSVDSNYSIQLMGTLDSLLNAESVDSSITPAQHLNHQAALRYREAVSNWLEDVQAAAIQPILGYALGRPKRGRPAKG